VIEAAVHRVVLNVAAIAEAVVAQVTKAEVLRIKSDNLIFNNKVTDNSEMDCPFFYCFQFD